VLAGLVARQKIPLNLPEIKELRNDEKWDLFDKHVQKHLKFQEDAKPQAFKLFWKTTTKAWRQFRFQLRRDFIRKGLEPFTRHPFIVPEQWKEFMKQAEPSKPHLLVSSSKNFEAGTQASTTWVQLVIL
jgi:hypothetical protein